MMLHTTHARPTLAHMLGLMNASGLDRASLVRERLPDRKPGLIIVMSTEKGLQALTPIIQQACAPLRYRNDKHLPLTLQEDLTLIFNWLEAAELDCIATGVLFQDGRTIVAHAIVGDAVNETLCAALTAAGCHTSLT